MQLGRRQMLLALAAIVAIPIRGKAQPAAKVARIGYLTARAVEFETPWLAAFRRGLRDLGYVEGQNIVLEERHADGRPERLPALAEDLVGMKVDVLVATESLSSIAAQKATQKIPIVSLSQDPVGLGLVKSLARPEGNVTGLTDYHGSMASKRLELLREIAPTASRFAVFLDPRIAPTKLQLKDLQSVAPSLKATLLAFEIRKAQDVESAFSEMSRQRIDSLILLPGGAISSNQRLIAAQATKARIPAIYTTHSWAELGGLIAYGTDFANYFHRAAAFVDKILKGAKPADLPIEQATTFQLVVNLRTAKLIGVTIPASVLVRADRVIQ